MTAPTPGQVAHEVFVATGNWDAVASAVASHLAEQFEVARGREGRSPAPEVAALQADLAAAEAEFGKWPRCPGGCRCRVGTEDADALECGCDGPCTTGWEPQAAPELAAALAKIKSRTDGYDPGTNEYDVHEIAASALAPRPGLPS